MIEENHHEIDLPPPERRRIKLTGVFRHIFQWADSAPTESDAFREASTEALDSALMISCQQFDDMMHALELRTLPESLLSTARERGLTEHDIQQFVAFWLDGRKQALDNLRGIYQDVTAFAYQGQLDEFSEIFKIKVVTDVTDFLALLKAEFEGYFD